MDRVWMGDEKKKEQAKKALFTHCIELYWAKYPLCAKCENYFCYNLASFSESTHTYTYHKISSLFKYFQSTFSLKF